MGRLIIYKGRLVRFVGLIYHSRTQSVGVPAILTLRNAPSFIIVPVPIRLGQWKGSRKDRPDTTYLHVYLSISPANTHKSSGITFLRQKKVYLLLYAVFPSVLVFCMEDSRLKSANSLQPPRCGDVYRVLLFCFVFGRGKTLLIFCPFECGK